MYILPKRLLPFDAYKPPLVLYYLHRCSNTGKWNTVEYKLMALEFHGLPYTHYSRLYTLTLLAFGGSLQHFERILPNIWYCQLLLFYAQAEMLEGAYPQFFLRAIVPLLHMY